jgi:proline dehydrogenase
MSGRDPEQPDADHTDPDHTDPEQPDPKHTQPEHPARPTGPAAAMRAAILAAGRSARVEKFVATAPISRNVAARFVAGQSVADAVATSTGLRDNGLLISIDYLGEDTADAAGAAATVAAYRDLLTGLQEAGLTGDAEVSLKLSALGAAFDAGLALASAAAICAVARDAGTFVTVDMEGSATVDATLTAVQALRADFPQTGAVLQAQLRRTEADTRDFAVAGSRVRLCKGAYAEAASVAFQTRAEVRDAYRRSLRILIDGPGVPLIATHDPDLLTAAAGMLSLSGRTADTYEVQLLHGVRIAEQRRLAGEGRRVRVYLPYGTEWYGYLMRRLAERPANLSFFLRALVDRA